MKSIKPMYVIIIVIVVAAAAFWGGVTYQKSKVSSFAAGGAGGRFGGRFGGGQGGYAGGGAGGPGGASGTMKPISGQIVSTSSNAITVKLSDGSSKIVDLSSQTKINKTTQGSASDLTTGQQVTAFGSTNSDGSVTAQAVNVGNGMMMHMRSGGPSGASKSGQPGQ